MKKKSKTLKCEKYIFFSEYYNAGMWRLVHGFAVLLSFKLYFNKEFAVYFGLVHGL